MTLQELHGYAETTGIHIYLISLHRAAFSTKFDGSFLIALSNSLTEYKERLALAEEIGHCETDSLYTLAAISNPCHRSAIDRAERRARDWAVHSLVPFSQLDGLLRKHYPIYEIAQIMDVGEEEIYDAIDYYQRKGKLKS